MLTFDAFRRWTLIERKAAYILAGIAACESIWVYFNIIGNSGRFWRYIGTSNPQQAGILGWVLSLTVATVFVLYSIRIPSVRNTIFDISRLKLLGILVACGASLCEESVFRKWIMDGLRVHGLSPLAQIAASALAFGLVHGIWGFMGRNFKAAFGAICATGILGGLLAAVYLASHRILLPCVVAHFLIDAFSEPGLVLGGLRGEMSRALPGSVSAWREQDSVHI